MSLKEKAKFPSDWCSYCQLERDECANSGCPLNGLWIRLEDAQQEIDEKSEALPDQFSMEKKREA